MKGVILAGGTGSRLYPNTKVTNKHLLPVYNKPMIYYPIENMIQAGITDILIMPGKDHAGDFAKLLGSGKEFNANFTFIIQDYAGGNAYPIKLIRNFVGDDSFLYIFGDNIIDYDFSEDVKNFKEGAVIFCKQVEDPERFGVAEVVDGFVKSIEEKPKNPKSNWAVIGAYIYDNKALDYVEILEPSARGEIEITDLNNIYINEGKMRAVFLEGDWYDTGTHKSLAIAAYNLMQKDKPIERLQITNKVSPKIGVGFILYESIEYLPYFLENLYKQDYKNLQFYAVNSNLKEDCPDVKYLKEKYPQIKIIQPKNNTGFAKGHNLMIRQAIKDGCEFYLCLNFDLLLEQNFISELLNSILKDNKNACATGKIKVWDFKNKDTAQDFGKTNFLDSTGLKITKEHRFLDRGQGEIDYGQYDKEEKVFGSSGTACLFRLSSLKDVAFTNEKGEKEFFDELMFMYKEDVDLAYRLQWAGYNCIYTPKAVAYHDRTVKSSGKGIFSIIKNRWNRNPKYKQWSWLNHHIILKKFIDNNYSWKVRLATFFYEIKTFIYILFFETYLLKQYWELFKLRNKIKERKKQIKKRIKNIEVWME